MKDKKKTKAKILIIDDDEITAKVLSKRLERLGFSTKVIADGNQAFDILEKEIYDLVLLDIVMPAIDGMSLLIELRKKFSKDQLPIIMITSSNDSNEIISAFENGANDYIVKPINTNAAAARIRGHISANELQQLYIKLKEFEAINALVVTYHHELNNPLAIAIAEMQLLEKKGGSIEYSNLSRIYTALKRISTTLLKIKEISNQNELTYDTYAKNSKMIKLKERP